MTQPETGLAESYREMGFVVVPGLLGLDEIDALRDEAVRVCRGERGEIRGLVQADPGERDEAVISRTHIIQLPHKVSPVMFELLSHPALTRVLQQIISPNSPLKKASLTGFHATAKHIAAKAVSPSSETMRTI